MVTDLLGLVVPAGQYGSLYHYQSSMKIITNIVSMEVDSDGQSVKFGVAVYLQVQDGKPRE